MKNKTLCIPVKETCIYLSITYCRNFWRESCIFFIETPGGVPAGSSRGFVDRISKGTLDGTFERTSKIS